ncbi:MAG: PAS domain S-box protein [Bacteroidia bacterium]|nr:PAS domain S-box protein [Bacteroidia bacterium]
MDKDNKKYNILVVEDNLGDFALIEEFLHEKFFAPKIDHAKNYKEVTQLLQNGNTVYDTVLLDLSLPDKNGEALIKDIVSFFYSSSIIVLTGYSDVSFGIKSLSFGIADYLLKDELNALSLYKSIIYNIERKKIFVEIEDSEKRYSDLFHMNPQPMWVYEFETLNFLDVNSAAIKHYGYSLNEFLSMTIKDIRPAEDVVKLEDSIKLMKENGDLHFHGILRHRKKNGEIIHVDIQSNIIIHKGQKVKVVIANDITERLNYIQTIEKQNENLKEIAWIQSHVVRAPLSRIMGLINLIKDQNVTEKEKKEFLNHILQSAEEFDVIIKDITHKSEKIQQEISKSEV